MNTPSTLSEIKDVTAAHEARRCGLIRTSTLTFVTHDFYGGDPLSIYDGHNRGKPLHARADDEVDELTQLQALLNIKYAIEMLNQAERDFLQVSEGWIASERTIKLDEIVEEFSAKLTGDFELTYSQTGN